MTTNQKTILNTSYTKPLLSIDNIPGTYLTRVFVGGCYTSQLAVLLEIKKYIHKISKGCLTSIFAEDFDMEGNVRNACFRLLHQCKYAIFEVTNSAGQIFEIEAAIDYETTFIVVHNSSSEEPVFIPGINMIDVRKQILTYRSLDELKSIIKVYLVQWKDSLR